MRRPLLLQETGGCFAKAPGRHICINVPVAETEIHPCVAFFVHVRCDTLRRGFLHGLRILLVSISSAAQVLRCRAELQVVMVRPWKGGNYLRNRSLVRFRIINMAFCIRDYHEMRRARAHIIRFHHNSENKKAASLLRLVRFKVSNRQRLAKQADLQGDAPYLRPVTLHMASLGLWTLPFCSLTRISPTFCSVASLPIESTPLFSSVGISTEWVLFPLQQQRDGRGLLLVAAHVTHGRQPWTTCRRRCTSELCSSRLRTAKPSTRETRGQACWSCTLPVETQLRKGADPSLNNQACSLRGTPACCTFASLVLRI